MSNLYANRTTLPEIPRLNPGRNSRTTIFFRRNIAEASITIINPSGRDVPSVVITRVPPRPARIRRIAAITTLTTRGEAAARIVRHPSKCAPYQVLVTVAIHTSPPFCAGSDVGRAIHRDARGKTLQRSLGFCALAIAQWIHRVEPGMSLLDQLPDGTRVCADTSSGLPGLSD